MINSAYLPSSSTFQALLVLPGPLDGWEVALDFSAPISNIESPMAEVTVHLCQHLGALKILWGVTSCLGTGGRSIVDPE